MSERFDPNQPRDPDGKWGSGMPSVISSLDLNLGGESGSMKAVPGDKVRVALGAGAVDVPSASGRKQIVNLQYQSGSGTREIDGDDGEPVLRFNFGANVETGEDDDGSPASVEFVGQGVTVGLTAAEVKSFVKSYERASAASRIEITSGPLDTYLEGSKFALRTKVSNADPVTKEFDARSWKRLHDAHQAVQEGYDDAGDYGPVGADIDELTVKTNAGEMVVSRSGDGDDVTVSISAAAQDDWFLTHTLDADDPIFDAFERLEESADELGFYNRNADGGSIMGATARPGRRSPRRHPTMHRALGYVDRTAQREGAPLRVVMASEGRMADNIDLRMAGADLARFRTNPVLGYGHSYWGRENLPIGRVSPESVTVEGTQIAGDLEFDQADDFAQLVERKMRDGFLNAVSIGFEVQQWESAEDSYWRGGVATKWELTELSVVPVPMDAAAVVTSGRGLDLADPDLIAAVRDCSDADFARLMVRLTAVSNVLAGNGPYVEPIGDPDPEPPAAGVPTDSARGLLDAFTITKESHA